MSFFAIPFAENGDQTAITITGSISGSASYQYGWTTRYQLDEDTDPNALTVDRGISNYVLNQITTALRQYQTNGVPDWISSSDNLGTPFAYPIYARVRYNAGGGVLVYENQVADNTVTPGSDSSWFVISGNNGGVPIGSVIPFDGSFPPAGYILRDGSQLNRVAFVNLFNAITFTISGTTTNTSTTLSGLTTSLPLAQIIYPGMPIEGAGIQSGTTVVSVSTTSIVMSLAATASATVTVRFFPHGNGNGTTTFTIGDSRGRSPIGSGGSGVAAVNGQTDGSATRSLTLPNMAPHNHAGSYVTSGTGAGFISVAEAGNSTVGSQPATIATEGSGTAFSIYHPVNVCTMCIRAQ